MKPPEIVAITQPFVLGGPKGDNQSEHHHLTAEEFIAYTARVSNPSNQMNNETAPKLLAYLVKNGHWSPFDMVDMIVKVHTTKAIAIQGLRHWSFRFQEFSQRYATVEELNFDHVEIREKAVGGNRQGSGKVKEESTRIAQEACQAAAETYQDLIDYGAAPESARMVLPMATPTTLYFKGSVRSWMTYFWQRCDTHAQKEHRDLAIEIFNLFEEYFPNIAMLVASHRPQVVETPGWMSVGR